MSFGLGTAIQVANQAALSNQGRSLSDVEIIILKGAWERLDYDQIAAQNKYSTTYISNDIAPKLWRWLSDALGEKVRKSNFKAALRRYWESIENDSKTSFSLQASFSLSAPASVIENQGKATNRSPKTQLEVEEPVIQEDDYILRPPIEDNCYNAITQPGSLLRIKAPNQMGKSRLVDYLLGQLTTQHYRTVHLSLELADRRKHLVDLGQFLRWFCLNVSRELGVPSELEDYWDEDGLGAKVSCTTYFEQYLLSAAETPLVLCLDDVDLLFPHPEVYEDFFGLLRSWHEKARSRRIWKKVRLVIVHATDVYIRLNIHQSPFNVGVPISLPEFTLEQAQALAIAHTLPGTIDQVKPILDWVGGHPYLLELAFLDLANRPQANLADLLADLTTNSGIYGAHLREHLHNLDQEPELAIAFKHTIQSPNGTQLKPMVAYKLQSMGLISLTGNLARCRCKLYTHYFTDYYFKGDIQENTPRNTPENTNS